MPLCVEIADGYLIFSHYLRRNQVIRLGIVACELELRTNLLRWDRIVVAKNEPRSGECERNFAMITR